MIKLFLILFMLLSVPSFGQQAYHARIPAKRFLEYLDTCAIYGATIDSSTTIRKSRLYTPYLIFLVKKSDDDGLDELDMFRNDTPSKQGALFPIAQDEVDLVIKKVLNLINKNYLIKRL